MGLDVVCKSLGGHSYSVFVHPVRADSHNAAKSSGAEFQVSVECILESCRIIVSQFNDLAFGFRIKVTGNPALDRKSVV